MTSTRILILVSKYLFVLQCYAISLSKKKAKLKAGIEIPVLYSPKNIRMPPGLSISTLRILNKRGGFFFWHKSVLVLSTHTDLPYKIKIVDFSTLPRFKYDCTLKEIEYNIRVTTIWRSVGWMDGRGEGTSTVCTVPFGSLLHFLTRLKL